MQETDIQKHVLSNDQVSVSILSLGGITQDWRVDDVPVVLGFADPADYLRHKGSMGVLVGRVANRIGGAKFTLDGQEYLVEPNEGNVNQCHGGPKGWSACNWQMEKDGDATVRLTLQSPDGDMGFPGVVDVSVVISLDGHCLTYDMTATPDRATPINMANHNFYNLQGSGPIWEHQMQIAAARYTETGLGLIPTGNLPSVQDTKYDFRNLRRLDDADPTLGITDTNFVLDQSDTTPACLLRAPNGMTLRLWTDQPGLQVYSGQGLSPRGTPLPGQDHSPCSGLALEAQGFPDSVNNDHFPSVIHTPENPYRQTTRIEIKPE